MQSFYSFYIPKKHCENMYGIKESPYNGEKNDSRERIHTILIN